MKTVIVIVAFVALANASSISTTPGPETLPAANQSSPITVLLTPGELLGVQISGVLQNLILNSPISGSLLQPYLPGLVSLVRDILLGLGNIITSLTTLAKEGDYLVGQNGSNSAVNPSNATLLQNAVTVLNAQVAGDQRLLNLTLTTGQQIQNATTLLVSQLMQNSVQNAGNPAALLNGVLSLLGTYILSVSNAIAQNIAGSIIWFEIALSIPLFPILSEYLGPLFVIYFFSTLQGIYNLADITEIFGSALRELSYKLG
jgi:hypothetical protein